MPRRTVHLTDILCMECLVKFEGEMANPPPEHKGHSLIDLPQYMEVCDSHPNGERVINHVLKVSYESKHGPGAFSAWVERLKTDPTPF